MKTTPFKVPAPSGALPDRRSNRAIDLDSFIPAALTNLAQKITATASAAYRPRFGIGITDWRIVALLAAEPWIAAVRIGEATGLDKAAVSRSLRNLIGVGLVEMREGSSNQRRVPLALTVKGLAVHDRVVEAALARQERLLDGFSASERARLQDFIARMRTAVEALEAEG